MRTSPLVAGLLAGLAVLAALPAAAGATLVVSSADPGTVLVRGDATQGGGEFSSTAGGSVNIFAAEGLTTAASNAAGCTQVDAQHVACPGFAGKTLDIDLGGGLAFSSISVAANQVPGAAVVYHGSADRDSVYALNSTLPLTISLGASDDLEQVVRGGSGADTIIGGPDRDSIFGSDGADTINGGPGNDTVDGAGDRDTVDGGAGEDTVHGGDGDDTLLGGSGDDTFPSVAGDGADAIDGGEGGQDVADYAARTVPLSLSLNGVADDGAAGEGDNLLGIETILGGTTDDTITGDAFTNYLTGNAGNDAIDGGDGFDVLRGGDGNDTLIGRDAGFVRDDVARNLGADTAIADFNDSVSSDCETVDRAPAPQPPVAPVVPVVPITPAPAAPVPDTRAPVVKLAGVPAGGRVTRALLRKGLTLKIGTDEAARLDVRIVRSIARAAAVAPKDNLTLVKVSKPRATGTRTVKLIPAAALLGRGAKTLKLVVVATDAAGNSTTVTRTLRLR
jgi:Ca2+-binding RTX toxin-like protein